MVYIDPEQILKAIEKHFPDAVDVVRAESLHLTEASRDLTQWDPPKEEGFIMTELNLTEIEPEAMIYAAMSPVTHRVYVFFNPYDFMNL